MYTGCDRDNIKHHEADEIFEGMITDNTSEVIVFSLKVYCSRSESRSIDIDIDIL